MEKENRLKDSFLRNITNKINEPLTRIVSLADKLSGYQELSQNERKKYSQEIQSDSNYLINMDCNVLDWSKLEAGMVKFNDHSYDLNSLIEGQDSIKAKFDNLVGSINTDKQFFNRIVKSLACYSKEDGECIDANVEVDVDNNKLHIIFSTNDFADSEDFKNDYVLHNLNKLFLQHFGAKYTLKSDSVEIIYPLT